MFIRNTHLHFHIQPAAFFRRVGKVGHRGGSNKSARFQRLETLTSQQDVWRRRVPFTRTADRFYTNRTLVAVGETFWETLPAAASLPAAHFFVPHHCRRTLRC